MKFARVESLSTELASASAAISSILEQLDATSGALRDAWGGDAQVAYANARAQWSRSAEGLASVLSGAHQAAEAAAERYREAEHRVVALWGTTERG